MSDSLGIIPLRYRIKHTVAFAYREPANWMGVILVCFFAYVIVAPVISILLNAGIVQVGDATRTHTAEGSWTSYYFIRTLWSRMSNLLLWTPMFHTLVIAITTVIVSLMLGVTLAWLVNRTDIAGRKWFMTTLIVPFMLPSWTFASRIIFKSITNVSTPINIITNASTAATPLCRELNARYS